MFRNSLRRVLCGVAAALLIPLGAGFAGAATESGAVTASRSVTDFGAVTASGVSGMTKINVSTHLNRVFTQALRDYLTAEPTVVDSRKYVRAGRSALANEAARLLTLFSVNSREKQTGR